MIVWMRWVTVVQDNPCSASSQCSLSGTSSPAVDGFFPSCPQDSFIERTFHGTFIPGHHGRCAAQCPEAQLSIFPLVLQVCEDLPSFIHGVFLRLFRYIFPRIIIWNSLSYVLFLDSLRAVEWLNPKAKPPSASSNSVKYFSGNLTGAILVC